VVSTTDTRPLCACSFSTQFFMYASRSSGRSVTRSASSFCVMLWTSGWFAYCSAGGGNGAVGRGWRHEVPSEERRAGQLGRAARACW
jgi:hypothetical protein